MSARRHLHIDSGDPLSDWLSKAMRSASNGTLEIDIANQPAVRIGIENGRISVDLLRPDVFRIQEDETGLFDKLKTATEFGRKLSDNGVTMSFLRRGREAVRIGKDAHPSFSKVITRSSDIQMTSVREFAKLKGDLKAD